MIPETNQPNPGELSSGPTGPTMLSPEFVADLKEVFAKHNWPGHPIGFVPRPAAATMTEDGEDDDGDSGEDGGCDPGPDVCPDGSIPQQVWVHCPDGTAILRNICK